MKREQAGGHEGEAFEITLGVRDELVEILAAFAREKGITHCRFTAMGGFSGVKLLSSDPDTEEYQEIFPGIDSNEILTLGGSLAFKGGEPHVHVMIIRADSTAQGGHLAEAQVEGAAEVALINLSDRHQPGFDEESSLLSVT